MKPICKSIILSFPLQHHWAIQGYNTEVKGVQNLKVLLKKGTPFGFDACLDAP